MEIKWLANAECWLLCSVLYVTSKFCLCSILSPEDLHKPELIVGCGIITIFYTRHVMSNYTKTGSVPLLSPGGYVFSKVEKGCT